MSEGKRQLKLLHAPMFWVLAPLVAGIHLATLFSPSLFLIIAFIALPFVLLLLWQRKFLILLPIFGLGLLTELINDNSSGDIQKLYNAQMKLNVGKRNRADIISIRSKDGSWEKCHNRVVITGIGDIEHQQITVRGNLYSTANSTSDFFEIMNDMGIKGAVRASKVISYGAKIPKSRVQKFNDWAFEKLRSLGLNKEAMATVSAVGVGRKELLTSSIKGGYTKTGTAHILALSGLHIGIILLIVRFFLFPLPILSRGHLIADTLAIIVAWIFAMMVGAGDSVLRATWMFSLLQFSHIISRNYSSFNSLMFASAAILLFDPLALYDPGFQLSVVAVAAIITLGVPLSMMVKTRNRLLNYAAKSVIVSIVAQIGTAPLVLYYFGYIALISPIATLCVIIPLTTIVVCSTLWIICPISSLAPLFRLPLECASITQNRIVEWFATHNVGLIKVKIEPTEVALFYAIIILSIILFTLIKVLIKPKEEEKQD